MTFSSFPHSLIIGDPLRRVAVPVGGRTEKSGNGAHFRTGRHGKGTGEERAQDFAGCAWRLWPASRGSGGVAAGRIEYDDVVVTFERSIDVAWNIFVLFLDYSSTEFVSHFWE